MAYYDESGKITIDEVAAQRDIAKIKEICDVLRESRASMRRIYEQSSEFKGKSVIAISEVSNKFLGKYDKLIAELEETADYIRATVAKYQKIDEQLKNVMNSNQ